MMRKSNVQSQPWRWPLHSFENRVHGVSPVPTTACPLTKSALTVKHGSASCSNFQSCMYFRSSRIELAAAVVCTAGPSSRRRADPGR